MRRLTRRQRRWGYSWPRLLTARRRSLRETSQKDPLDRGRPSRAGIDRRDGRAKLFRTVLLHVEPIGDAVQESVEDGTRLHADHPVGWAGHSDIANVRGAARQNVFIGRLDVGMRSENARDASI